MRISVRSPRSNFLSGFVSYYHFNLGYIPTSQCYRFNGINVQIVCVKILAFWCDVVDCDSIQFIGYTLNASAVFGNREDDRLHEVISLRSL